MNALIILATQRQVRIDKIEKTRLTAIMEHHTENALVFDRIFARNSPRKLLQFFSREVTAWLWGKQFVALDQKQIMRFLSETKTSLKFQGELATFEAFHKQLQQFAEECGFPTLPRGA